MTQTPEQQRPPSPDDRSWMAAANAAHSLLTELGVTDEVGYEGNTWRFETRIKRLAAERDEWKRKAEDADRLSDFNIATAEIANENRDGWKCRAEAAEAELARLREDADYRADHPDRDTAAGFLIGRFTEFYLKHGEDEAREFLKLAAFIPKVRKALLRREARDAR